MGAMKEAKDLSPNNSLVVWASALGCERFVIDPLQPEGVLTHLCHFPGCVPAGRQGWWSSPVFPLKLAHRGAKSTRFLRQEDSKQEEVWLWPAKGMSSEFWPLLKMLFLLFCPITISCKVHKQHWEQDPGLLLFSPFPRDCGEKQRKECLLVWHIVRLDLAGYLAPWLYPVAQLQWELQQSYLVVMALF